MTNKEVIRLFIAGDRRARSAHLWIRAWARGTELVHHSTTVARRGGSWCEVATARYSRETTMVQAELRAQLRNAHMDVIETEEVVE